MRNQDSTFASRNGQNIRIIQLLERGGLCGLEVNSGLSPFN